MGVKGAVGDIAMLHYTPIVTLLAVALYFFLATRTSHAAALWQIRRATSGNVGQP